MKQTGIHMMIELFAKSQRMRVCNVKDASGIDDVIECFGFDENGFPVLNKKGEPILYNEKIKYRFSGGFVGSVNLNSIFDRGVSIYGRSEKGETVVVKKLEGFEAVACQLQRAGCYISPQAVEKKIETCVRNGNLNVYFFRSCFLSGLQEGYGFIEDE